MQDPPQPRTSSLAGPVQDKPDGECNIFQGPGGDQIIMQTIESIISLSWNIESDRSMLQNPQYTVPIFKSLRGVDATTQSAQSYKGTTPAVRDCKQLASPISKAI